MTNVPWDNPGLDCDFLGQPAEMGCWGMLGMWSQSIGGLFQCLPVLAELSCYGYLKLHGSYHSLGILKAKHVFFRTEPTRKSLVRYFMSQSSEKGTSPRNPPEDDVPPLLPNEYRCTKQLSEREAQIVKHNCP